MLNRVRDRLESLDVSGVSSVIDMDATAPYQRLTSAELIDIPYKSNNDLRNSMRVMPGVVQDAAGGIHVNGAAEQQVQYTLDGFNITDPLTGTFQTRLSVESVQSMTVLSGAIPAEYGKGAAGVLAVNTRTGDDTWRYSATNFFPGVEYRKGLILGSFTPRLNLSGADSKGQDLVFRQPHGAIQPVRSQRTAIGRGPQLQLARQQYGAGTGESDAIEYSVRGLARERLGCIARRTERAGPLADHSGLALPAMVLRRQGPDLSGRRVAGRDGVFQ